MYAVLLVSFVFHSRRNVTDFLGVTGYAEILRRDRKCVSRRQLRIGKHWRGLLAEGDRNDNKTMTRMNIGEFLRAGSPSRNTHNLTGDPSSLHLIDKKRNCPRLVPRNQCAGFKLARKTCQNQRLERRCRGDAVIFDPSLVINLTGLGRY
jgi:hypothetical protein